MAHQVVDVEDNHVASWVWAESEDGDGAYFLDIEEDVGWKERQLGTLQLVPGVPLSFDQSNFEFAAPRIADSSYEHLPKNVSHENQCTHKNKKDLWR